MEWQKEWLTKEQKKLELTKVWLDIKSALKVRHLLDTPSILYNWNIIKKVRVGPKLAGNDTLSHR